MNLLDFSMARIAANEQAVSDAKKAAKTGDEIAVSRWKAMREFAKGHEGWARMNGWMLACEDEVGDD